eukprot:CAMPEP_0196652926 /NCGR_PEP_ID=MMETSP1086-20130531/2421_1 /TAXON_ID=77921 /ORGANISM="Cyanoptyche  gloeocystis , Strain SAG4.97" /LENGTH=43 /DNA_ID= /DNA_START= /DNA_END= /DNA_ORIENTATION=
MTFTPASTYGPAATTLLAAMVKAGMGLVGKENENQSSEAKLPH